MSRRLATIARHINAYVDGYTAEIEPVEVDTDRKVGRLRWPGKGRRGNRLRVWHDKTRRTVTPTWSNPHPGLVLDHNSAETYRRNSEVEAWLARLERCLSAGHRGPTGMGWDEFACCKNPEMVRAFVRAVEER